MSYVNQFLIALVCTVVIETGVLLLGGKLFLKKDKVRITDIFFAGFFASFATLPYLWFILPVFLRGNLYIGIGEALVILAETVVISQIMKINLAKSFILSFTANAISFMLGLFLLPALINL